MSTNKSINKYTNKIKKLLDTNFSDDYEEILKLCLEYDNNEIIKKFIKIFSEIPTEENISIIKSEKIKKLHTYDDESLLQVILQSVYENKYFETTEEFFEWARENGTKIKIDGHMFSDFHQILFNPSENRKELHRMMYESIFVSADVLHHSESEDLNYKVFMNENTEIHLYHPDSNNGPDIQIIMKIINFYRILFSSEIKVKLTIFYGEQKKFLYNFKPSHTICSDNINSGSSIKHEIIQIWRKEEFYKVLIHELVHYFGVDFYLSNSIYQKINNHFQSVIKINGIDRINESYTETLAIVIHSCLYSILYQKPFSEIFSYEILFTYFQVSKLLIHFGCKNYQNISNTIFNQTTSAFSYYVVKCMLMQNLSKMFDFWENHHFVILKNKNSQTSYHDLYKEIVNLNSLNADLIDKFINFIDNEKSKISQNYESSDCFVFNTMRMSMFQL